MNSQTLSNSLFTKTQQRVLGLLYGAPGKSFYTNEVVRIAAVGRGTVTRELAKLEEAGVLTVSAAGNRKHYQANPECLVYAELVKIVRKLFEVESPARKTAVTTKIKSATKPLKENAEKPEAKLREKPQTTGNEVPKINAEPQINITVDEEGQLGFF